MKVHEVENVVITDLSPEVDGQVTYRVIYSEEVLGRFSSNSAAELKVDFNEEMLIVLYNGMGRGKVNPLGATFLVKPQYLKVGYSMIDNKPFQPYTVIRIKKLEFKTLQVLPYKKYVKSKEKWF